MYNYHIRLTSTASMKELDYITKQLDTTLNTVENFGKTIAVTPSVQTFTDKFNAAPETFNPLDAFKFKKMILTRLSSQPLLSIPSPYILLHVSSLPQQTMQQHHLILMGLTYPKTYGFLAKK